MGRLVYLAVSGLLAIALAACGEGESKPVTIMPIGDSITHAQAGTPSYRCFLDAMLRDAGVVFGFAGGQTWPYSGTEYSCPVEFDQDHEGYTGVSISSAGLRAAAQAP